MGLRWRPQPLPPPWARLEDTMKDVEHLIKLMHHEMHTAAKQAAEGHKEVMATLQDLRDALTEQNAAILSEIDQINTALANASGVPQDVVDSVKSSTATIKGIIADPLPEPVPEPNPNPEPGRGRR